MGVYEKSEVPGCFLAHISILAIHTKSTSEDNLSPSEALFAKPKPKGPRNVIHK